MREAEARCCACAGREFLPLADFGMVPRSGIYTDSPEAEVATLRLAYEFCRGCGLLRRLDAGDAWGDYASIDRPTGGQLPEHREEIARSLKDAGLTSRDLVIEVGSNDGTFLAFLRSRGFGNLLGVEPSKSLAEAACKLGFEVEAAHFDLKLAGKIRRERGPARAVVCRHTLEHVPDPFRFAEALRGVCAEDGLAFVEVPVSEGILERLQVYELWDEHLTVFNPAGLRRMLGRAGLKVARLKTALHVEETVALAWARPSRPLDDGPPEFSRDAAGCAGFPLRWDAFRDRLRDFSASWKGPVAAMGASHPQANFLLYTGLAGKVSVLIDDDPAKQGRFLPLPRPVPIRATQDVLKGEAPGTVLRTAFGYSAWMDTVCEALRPKGTRAADFYPIA